jgi:hypothetical protein
VRGQAFNDADFNQGSDEITYRFPVAVPGDLNVSVSLNYQTIAFGYLQDLYHDDHLEQVQTFKTLYDAQSLKYEQIASAQTTVLSDGGGTPVEPVVNLSVSSPTIDQGQSATLKWDSTDATSCSVSGGWNGSRATSGSELVSPTATTSYTLSCNGDGGSASASVTVTVNQPAAPVPVVNLSVSSPTIDLGQSATLNWDSTDATSCTASGGWIGNRATSGSEVISPTVTTSYTISCDGDGGSASASVTVTVNQPAVLIQPTLSLTASPTSVSRGGTITLNWVSTDAISCSASGDWSGSKATSGSTLIVINNPVTFTLSCSGAGGSVSQSVSYQARGRRWLNLQ